MAATSLGVLVNFGGLDHSDRTLTLDEYNSIVKEYLRLKLVTSVKGILYSFYRTKPETIYDNFIGSFGDKYIEGYGLAGHTAADVFPTCPLEDSF